MSAALVAAINRCCRLRGDTEQNRLDLIAECLDLDGAGQADMTEHFEVEADRWAPAGDSA
jgi:hypothetical protein